MKFAPKLIDFSDETIYVGIDVHKRSWNVSIRFNGSEMKTFSMPPEPSQLWSHLAVNYPGGQYKCVYEAGFCGFWIQRQLTLLGIECQVIHPADVPTTDKERKRKSDVVDSRKLARGLENDELTPIFVPDQELEDSRQIVRRRVQLIKDRTRVKNRIKQFLNCHGIEQPTEFSAWTRKYLAWLKVLDLPGPMARVTLDTLLEQHNSIHRQVLMINLYFRQLSKSPRYAQDYELLVGIPSIGTISAMTLLTELGDINRFSSLDQLCSYVGLVPDTSSSADKQRTHGITKRGNSFLRRALVECAWVIIRKDPAMALAYKEYCTRMTAKRAVIRICKKLLSRIRYVLKNKKPYRLGLN
jgi:transposase